jgi:carboxyl-terminal processing protease
MVGIWGEIYWIAAMPRRNLWTISISLVVAWLCHAKAIHNRYGHYLSEVFETIEAEALEPVESPRLYQAGVLGMLETLDPYSGYVPPEHVLRFESELEQEFAGIGISVRPGEGPDGVLHLVVISPMLGTPAFEAGVRAGDIILRVDGKEIGALSVDEAISRMRGPEGRPVVLTIRRDDRIEDKSIVRARIKVDSVLGDSRTPDGTWNFFLSDYPHIGYIRVTTFGVQTVDELERALEQLEERGDTKGLVLDIRGNNGGLLKAAVQTCDFFIDEGEVVSTRDRRGEVLDRYLASGGSRLSGLPMAVLVDRDSASASEIVAACLQDHGRGVVVGERTYGKGTVQTVLGIEGGRARLRLTTAAYWRPSGRNIHRRREADASEVWGVQPDEGFQIALADEERERVYLDRQRRDVVGPVPSLESSTGGATVQTTDPIDRQLARAVEYVLAEPGP